jgi:hypothetical protein
LFADFLSCPEGVFKGPVLSGNILPANVFRVSSAISCNKNFPLTRLDWMFISQKTSRSFVAVLVKRYTGYVFTKIFMDDPTSNSFLRFVEDSFIPVFSFRLLEILSDCGP